MSNKIESMIEDIENYVDGCKFQAFSADKIVVNKDVLISMLEELKSKTPEEIKKYQKIINNHDAIINDAKAKAEEIINAAQIKNNELVSECEIMQQAYAKANEVIIYANNQAQEMLDNAMTEANSIKEAAVNYLDQKLESIESVLTSALDLSKSRFDSFYESLQDHLEIISNDKKQLVPVETGLSEDTPVQENPSIDNLEVTDLN